MLPKLHTILGTLIQPLVRVNRTIEGRLFVYILSNTEYFLGWEI